MLLSEKILRKRNVRGSLLSVISYPARNKVQTHSHETANFCIGLRGTCVEKYGSRCREYEPLSLMFLPAGHEHSLEIHNAGVRSFSILVSSDLLKTVNEYLLKPYESVHSSGGELAHLFINLYREFNETDDASALAIEGLTLEMLAAVSRNQAKTLNDKSPRWLELKLFRS